MKTFKCAHCSNDVSKRKSVWVEHLKGRVCRTHEDVIATGKGFNKEVRGRTKVFVHYDDATYQPDLAAIQQISCLCALIRWVAFNENVYDAEAYRRCIERMKPCPSHVEREMLKDRLSRGYRQSVGMGNMNHGEMVMASTAVNSVLPLFHSME
jgi:hypothetical protein